MSEFSLVARILGDISSLEANFNRANAIILDTQARVQAMNAPMEQAGLNWDRIGKLATAGAAVVAVASVAMASSFEAAMLRIQTQAGAAEAEVTKMSKAVLKLGPEVGFAPKALAEALYFVESAGIRGAEALNILKLAAEGAQISGANLTDVTKGLTAVLVSGIPGVRDAHDAISQLNAIVGAGMLTMQDLTKAMASGILATGKEFGVSLTSIGTALASMTSTAVPAEQAATRLRMGLNLLAAPTQQATKVLSALGVGVEEVKLGSDAATEALAKAHVTTTQFASDLRQPNGIVVALRDLTGHLRANGVSAEETGAILSRAFGGGRQGQAIIQLISNLDQADARYKQIIATTGDFDKSWQATERTSRMAFEKIKASIDTLAISIGTALLPSIEAAISFTERHSEAAKVLAAMIGTVLVGAGVHWIAVQSVAFAEAAVGSIVAMTGAVASLGATITGATGALTAFAGGLGVLLIAPALLAGARAADQHNDALKKLDQTTIGWESHIPLVGNALAGLDRWVLGLGDSHSKTKTATDAATAAADAHAKTLQQEAAAAHMTIGEFKALGDEAQQLAVQTGKAIDAAVKATGASFAASFDLVGEFSTKALSKASGAADRSASQVEAATDRVAKAEQSLADTRERIAQQNADEQQRYEDAVNASNERIQTSETNLSELRQKLAQDDARARDDYARRVFDAQRKVDDAIRASLEGQEAARQRTLDAEQALNDLKERNAARGNPGLEREVQMRQEMRRAQEAISKAKDKESDAARSGAEAIDKAKEAQAKVLSDAEKLDEQERQHARQLEAAEAAVRKAHEERAKIEREHIKNTTENISQARELRNAVQSVEEAQEALNKAQRDGVTAASGGADAGGDASPAELHARALKFYQDALTENETFLANYRKAIVMGFDPALIASILEKGPKQASAILAAITSEQDSTYVEQMNSLHSQLVKGQHEAERNTNTIRESLKVGNEGMLGDYKTFLGFMDAESKRGGKLTASDLAHEFGLGTDRVLDIINEFNPELAKVMRAGGTEAQAALVDGIRTGLDPIAQLAKAFAEGLLAGINPVLLALGKDTIVVNPSINPSAAGPPSPGGSGTAILDYHTADMATGGRVPGFGVGDTVPAMLTPGEYVLPAHVVAAVGAHNLDKSIKRFATGGFVSADDVPPIPNYGAFGTMGQGTATADSELRDRVIAWVVANAGKGGGGGGSPSGGPSGPVPTGQVADWVRAGIALAGKPEDWITPEVRMAMFESGGDPRAINLDDWNAQQGHPSKGLLQTIDSTFNAYKVSGHDDIWNPIDNVAAATNYIASRYGTPWNTPGERAIARGEAYQGYNLGGLVKAMSFDEGGWLAPGATLALNGTGRPERVGGSGGDTHIHIHFNAPVAGDYKALGAKLAEHVQDALDRKRRNNPSIGLG